MNGNCGRSEKESKTIASYCMSLQKNSIVIDIVICISKMKSSSVKGGLPGTSVAFNSIHSNLINVSSGLAKASKAIPTKSKFGFRKLEMMTEYSLLF